MTLSMKLGQARRLLALFERVENMAFPPLSAPDSVADAVFRRHERDMAALDAAIMDWLRDLARETALKTLNSERTGGQS